MMVKSKKGTLLSKYPFLVFRSTRISSPTSFFYHYEKATGWSLNVWHEDSHPHSSYPVYYSGPDQGLSAFLVKLYRQLRTGYMR
jgi:hypothetical protein